MATQICDLLTSDLETRRGVLPFCHNDGLGDRTCEPLPLLAKHPHFLLSMMWPSSMWAMYIALAQE